MAAIVKSDITGTGQKVVNVTTLGATDTLTFNPAKNPILILDNVTAGALTPLIDGDAAVDVPCAGVLDIVTSAGLSLASIAANDVVAIPLNSINAYLKGVITITGADGIKATLLEF